MSVARKTVGWKYSRRRQLTVNVQKLCLAVVEEAGVLRTPDEVRFMEKIRGKKKKGRAGGLFHGPHIC